MAFTSSFSHFFLLFALQIGPKIKYHKITYHYRYMPKGTLKTGFWAEVKSPSTAKLYVTNVHQKLKICLTMGNSKLKQNTEAKLRNCYH